MSNTTVIIDSFVSSTDGLTAFVQTSGNPTGTLSFYASRINDLSRAAVVTQVSINPYILTFPHDGIWFLWAHDDNGYSLNPVAELVATSPHLDMDAVGRKVRDILVTNKIGLEACLRKVYPTATIKNIEYGTEADIASDSSIVVGHPSYHASWAFMPYGKNYDYSLTITCRIRHYDEDSQMVFINALTGGVERILNTPPYDSPALDNGLRMYSCIAQQAGCEQSEMGGYFISEGTVSWIGNAIIQDGGY